MKITVDRIACVGEPVCTGLAPQVFGLDEERKAIIVIDEETGEHLYAEDDKPGAGAARGSGTGGK